MTIFIVGLIVFFAVHSVSIVAPRWRAEQIDRLGEGAWKGLYSGLAAVGLGLLIFGYGVARQAPVTLYTPLPALRHLALALMVPVFPLLLAAYLPGRIRMATKHPMLLAVKLWASAHLLANGTLADVLLFGAFLLWAIADRISAKRRAMTQPPRITPSASARPWNDVLSASVGLVLYALFVWRLHQWLFGVAPFAALR